MQTSAGGMGGIAPGCSSPATQVEVPAPGAPPSLTPPAPGAVSHRLLIGGSLAALYLIWGSTYFAMKVALETLPPFLMASVRFILAGGLLYGGLRLSGAPNPTGQQWISAARTGVLLLACGNGFVAVGQRWVSSGFAAVVVATMPLWMALISTFHALRGVPGAQRPSRGEWTGLLVGFAGAALLQAGGELRAAHPAALVILLAPVCWAFGSLQSRTLPMPAGPMANAAQMLTGGAVMLVVSFALGEPFPTAPSTRSLLAVGYLIVFGSIVAFSAYGFLLRHARPAVATSYAYVNPLVAIVLGAMLAGELVATSTWVAAGIILAGVAIVAQARAAAPASHRAPAQR
ncbi:drug/metabolite exporter YedA [Chondromyces apiculatus]|uniref:Permease of the drug/metabolite transporter (DMT) superfamily n=1 Tax=Chondromyces apiculatus DSM 436 TaxID=1192034 RepID=A0A017T318_9BACT|nr:drug/metabolite exporter YedA [Chondromyces apiculatus]EYF03613.1 Permease of the drug/metabolite transporter (DMT) superfamily [Chondromyces apiculatus DSM 436]